MDEQISAFVALARKTANEGLAETEEEVVDFIKSLVLIGLSDFELSVDIMEYEFSIEDN